MRFSFSEEQLELRRMLRGLLTRDCPLSRVREAVTSPSGYDEALWQRLSTELGLGALVISEEYGGAGFGWVELCAVQEELGRCLAPVPLLSAALGAAALAHSEDAAQKAAWLTRLADGGCRAAVVCAPPTPKNPNGAVTCRYRRTTAGFELSGVVPQSLDAHAADLLLVPALEDGGQAVSLFLLDTSLAGAPGLARERLPTLDSTRPLGRVRLDQLAVDASSLLAADGQQVLRQHHALGSIALAAEQVGGAEACLDLAVEYAKTRTQFERPIGSFQAIKHKCADLLVAVESARSAAYYAAWAASVAAPDVVELGHLCASYCSEAYFKCAADNLQIHGGIGFTWEHDAHLFLKRARGSEALFGPPAMHREQVAQLLLSAPPGRESLLDG